MGHLPARCWAGREPGLWAMQGSFALGEHAAGPLGSAVGRLVAGLTPHGELAKGFSAMLATAAVGKPVGDDGIHQFSNLFHRQFREKIDLLGPLLGGEQHHQHAQDMVADQPAVAPPFIIAQPQFLIGRVELVLDLGAPSAWGAAH